jgi:hypothetical protein
MSRFDPKAITVAMLLSLALDLFGQHLLLAAMVPAVTPGVSSEAAFKLAMEVPEFLLALLVYGTGPTLFGGYVAARLARRTPYFNAMAIGALGIVLSLVLSTVVDSEVAVPFWWLAAGYLLSLPAAVLGGHLALRQRNQ